MTRVHVLSLGGTITMTPGDEGPVVPSLDADALLSGVELDGIEVTGRTVRRIQGAALTPRDVLDVVRMAHQTGDGVVIVQGTDTLEETAYLADLVWQRAEPIVFTGAMRTPAMPGADGVANLVAAIRTAATPDARNRGALVVMNDEIHAAHRIRKLHAEATQAFGSGEFGLLGRLVEGRAVFGNRVDRHPPIDPVTNRDPWVAMLETHLGDDGTTLNTLLDAGIDGVVMSAYGAGHVSPELVTVIDKCVPRIPVVLATRTGGGTTLRATYGFPGSESDLLSRGVIPAGWLDPRKARLLLWLLRATGTDVTDTLPTYGEHPSARYASSTR